MLNQGSALRKLVFKSGGLNYRTVQDAFGNIFERDNLCYYSEANVTFAVPSIDSARATAGSLPTGYVTPEQRYPVRGGSNLANEIAQLFVDLYTDDSATLERWVRANPGLVPPQHVIGARINRFSQAFETMFTNKKLVEVVQENGEYKAIFEENGRRTSLADLSTGEKQIVFRGAFLLRQLEQLPGSIILVDEPELSLHPTWQTRVLDFYAAIVTESEEYSSQVIFATHSPFVVHGSPTAKHVVLKRSHVTGQVYSQIDAMYVGTTPTEVAVATFDLANFIASANGKRLAVVVEGPTDQVLLEAAWEKLRPNVNRPFVVQAAGGARPVQQLLGNERGKSGVLFEALVGVGVERIIGLFDFDQEGYSQWNGTIRSQDAIDICLDEQKCVYRKRVGAPTWAALLPVPSFRRAYASVGLGSRSILTIELLFRDQDIAHLLTSAPVTGVPGATIFRATDAQKKEIATLAPSLSASCFVAFEPILALIEHVISVQL